ncbi:UvrABC system protein C [Desulfobacca acetoxidans DSM 11109]|uniref:UvrABC system protein C n=1 Tax=Desulfobacca acetoxidans (strain ATCC 700848 / DSM 11109 / ASRB2) TaxID=880072 RepID=F2NE98_DESAR|nr:UvrABC system protein C [Desulfobacca acetoxidans DSM 11109]
MPNHHPLCPALAAALPHIPSGCGVYLFKGAREEVLYVGKAVNLKNRLQSYLRDQPGLKTAALLEHIVLVDFLVTATEREALILERNLIKQHRPRYNINLRDDKNFLCLRLDIREEVPRLRLVRRFAPDGARYFGPYTSSAAVRELLKFMKKVFRLRSCKDRGIPKRIRPCLNYQMGQCLAPCCGLVSLADYHQAAQEALLFLQGQGRKLRQELTVKMHQAAAELRYEEAASLRDRLALLERTLAQQVVQNPSTKDQDVLGLAREEETVMVVVLLVRRGMVTGSLPYFFKKVQEDDADLLEAFLKQYYSPDRFVPDEVLSPLNLEDKEVLEDLLKEQKGANVRLLFPRQGPRRQLLDLAQDNAMAALKRQLSLGPQIDPAVELQERLKLGAPPRRLACLDISHLQGSQPVGAMVVFWDNQPDKSAYRRFRIRDVVGQDDPAMLAETVRRQFTAGDSALPDLLVIDGGLGQLSVVGKTLEDIGIADRLPVIGLAKAGILADGRAVRDRIYLPGRKNPLFLPPNSPALFLLMRLRDEAHRFAISFHRKKAREQALHSVLDQIPGLGPKRRQRLMQRFPDIASLHRAPLAELINMPNLPRSVAEDLHRLLNNEGHATPEPQSAPESGQNGVGAADSPEAPGGTPLLESPARESQ